MGLLHKEELKDDEGVFVQIELPLDDDWLYINWIGYQDEYRIRTGMNRIIVLLKKFNIYKLLNNNNNHHGGYPKSIYNWIENDWLPRALESGLRCTATILSPKVFSRLSAIQMETKFDSGNYKNFDDKEDAEKWLKSMQK
jgi:hypothetical protein